MTMPNMALLRPASYSRNILKHEIPKMFDFDNKVQVRWLFPKEFDCMSFFNATNCGKTCSRTDGRYERTNGRTDGQTVGRTNERTDEQTDRMDGQIGEQTDWWTNRRTKWRTDKRTNGWTDGQTKERMNGRTGAYGDGKYSIPYRHILCKNCELILTSTIMTRFITGL